MIVLKRCRICDRVILAEEYDGWEERTCELAVFTSGNSVSRCNGTFETMVPNIGIIDGKIYGFKPAY